MGDRAVCHLLIGPPGSGKSTLAAKMQALLAGSCIVSTDQIRQALYGDESDQGHWPDIEVMVCQQIEAAVTQGKRAIYDATNAKRMWRMALLQKLALLGIDWVGWQLTTPLETCQQWNRMRDRAVPAAVIDSLHAALQQFPPCPAEGFVALYPIDPVAEGDQIQAKLDTLDRSITNRANRTRHTEVQPHRYSALLDFDRLMHLISLLVQYPGLGELRDRDPALLRQLLGEREDLPATSLAEICAVMAQQKGSLYADAAAIADDLTWLEENGFFSAAPTDTDLTRPPCRDPQANPHAYSDWDACQRLLTAIRFIAQHPFCWDPEQRSSLTSLVSAMQQRGLLVGDRQAALRKDIERVLKPFGILPPFRMRRGYFIGSGVLSEPQLLRVASLLQAQAKNIQDPAALAILDTLRSRLQRSQHDLDRLYPVRAIGNRTIIDLERLPASALARNLEALEAEIETGQLLELKRFAGVGRFEETEDDFFLAWPLQIVFHNIAWYLGYELAAGAEAGLLQFQRLDRLFRGRPQRQQRSLAQQRQSLERLERLYRACGGLHLGNSTRLQRQFLSSNAKARAASSIYLELWFTDDMFRFISEGTQRFPVAQMKMSPKLTGNAAANDPLFCLEKSDDPHYPHRWQVRLPRWSLADRDLRRWILGFGDRVCVVSPQEWVGKIRDIGRAIAQLYDADERDDGDELVSR